jgi:hypothetical protein
MGPHCLGHWLVLTDWPLNQNEQAHDEKILEVRTSQERRAIQIILNIIGLYICEPT